MRQAFAGMLWSKQYYGYNVARWLDGDPGLPPPPAERDTGRNADWRHFDAADIMSMPDPWEYPWFAAWDLAFHAITLAHVDPTFAKYQLLLLCREWFQHPDGALPAYEWSFDDVNPPIHAARRADGLGHRRARRHHVPQADLPQAAAELHVVDEPRGQGRQRHLLGRLPRASTTSARSIARTSRRVRSSSSRTRPPGCSLTAWRCSASRPRWPRPTRPTRTSRRPSSSTAVRIGAAMDRSGLWDAEDGFYFDALKLHDGSSVPIKVHSMVGLIPLLPTSVIPARIVGARPGARQALRQLPRLAPCHRRAAARRRLRQRSNGRGDAAQRRPAGLARAAARRRCCRRMGSCRRTACVPCRRRHAAAPFQLDLGGFVGRGRLRAGRVDVGHVRRQLELARAGLDSRSTTWSIQSLRNWDAWMGADFMVEYPTGSGTQVRLRRRRRWTSPAGSSPSGCPTPMAAARSTARTTKFQTDPEWRDLLLFHEYFHGDTGAGIGARTRPAGPGSWRT